MLSTNNLLRMGYIHDEQMPLLFAAFIAHNPAFPFPEQDFKKIQDSLPDLISSSSSLKTKEQAIEYYINFLYAKVLRGTLSQFDLSVLLNGLIDIDKYVRNDDLTFKFLIFHKSLDLIELQLQFKNNKNFPTLISIIDVYKKMFAAYFGPPENYCPGSGVSKVCRLLSRMLEPDMPKEQYILLFKAMLDPFDEKTISGNLNPILKLIDEVRQWDLATATKLEKYFEGRRFNLNRKPTVDENETNNDLKSIVSWLKKLQAGGANWEKTALDFIEEKVKELNRSYDYSKRLLINQVAIYLKLKGIPEDRLKEALNKHNIYKTTFEQEDFDVIYNFAMDPIVSATLKIEQLEVPVENLKNAAPSNMPAYYQMYYYTLNETDQFNFLRQYYLLIEFIKTIDSAYSDAEIANIFMLSGLKNYFLTLSFYIGNNAFDIIKDYLVKNKITDMTQLVRLFNQDLGYRVMDLIKFIYNSIPFSYDAINPLAINQLINKIHEISQTHNRSRYVNTEKAQEFISKNDITPVQVEYLLFLTSLKISDSMNMSKLLIDFEALINLFAKKQGDDASTVFNQLLHYGDQLESLINVMGNDWLIFISMAGVESTKELTSLLSKFNVNHEFYDFFKTFFEANKMQVLSPDESEAKNLFLSCIELSKTMEKNRVPLYSLTYSVREANALALHKAMAVAIIKNCSLTRFNNSQIDAIVYPNIPLSDVATYYDPLIFKLKDESKVADFLKNFNEFRKKFDSVNSGLEDPEQHSRDLNEMMQRNHGKFQSLINIMGDKAPLFMKKYLITSALLLQRVLEGINIDRKYDKFLSEIFSNNANLILTGNNHETFTSIMQLISFAGTMNISPDDLKEALSNDLAATCQSLAKIIIGGFFKIINITGVNYETILKRIPLKILSSLLNARNKMTGQAYQEIFEHFLMKDFDVDLSANEDSITIQNLHEHNKNIRDELDERGINNDLAFSYAKKQQFGFGGTIGGYPYQNTVLAIWYALHAILNQLNKIAPQLSGKELNQLKNTIKLIGDFFRANLKGHEAAPVNLSPDQCLSVFNALKSNIESAGTSNPSRIDSLVATIDKLPQEVKTQLKNPLNQLKQNASNIKQVIHSVTINQPTAKPVKYKEFEIVMWDKSSPQTFALGNYVGCCLSTDSSQFPAMVERRMDDDMFMHVVIDRETEQPVSLAWLFFAKDKRPPHDVYVIANFFEIAAGYTYDHQLRDTIVQHLQEYIGQYAKAVGAKGFLMNKLTYGSIPDFKDSPIKQIEIEKVGGFLNLQTQGPPYYLRSLQNSEFYVYQPRMLTPVSTYKESPFHYPSSQNLNEAESEAKQEDEGRKSSINPNK